MVLFMHELHTILLIGIVEEVFHLLGLEVFVALIPMKYKTSLILPISPQLPTNLEQRQVLMHMPMVYVPKVHV